jgi:K+-sensing histidine kinase KdpD
MSKWDFDRSPTLLGDVLGLLAHDLRNPLSALHSNLGYLETTQARAPQANDDVQEAIADGLVSCSGLSHIVDNLSFLAQSLRGSAGWPALPTPIGELAREAVQQAQMLAKSHGVNLRMVVAADAERAYVNASRDVLQRAFANLAWNNIQFSTAGANALINIDVAEQSVHITFQDVGPSLLGREREACFGLEAQLDTKTSADGRYSRWLGLFVANVAAEAAGGSLQVVEPEANFSSALRLILPRYIAAP